MSQAARDFTKIKTLDDFLTLDGPVYQPRIPDLPTPPEDQMILRMLVRPKYGMSLAIPKELSWLDFTIRCCIERDRQLTGIKDSWCYVTVRSGLVSSTGDDDWHFDGASFRTTLIPERNYVWTSDGRTQYKLGSVKFHDGFDPNKYNMFTYAERAVASSPTQLCQANKWYLFSPFCLHRRDPLTAGTRRTFVRISFPDIEARDINNTPNPFLPTPAYGRDPVKNFRSHLKRGPQEGLGKKCDQCGKWEVPPFDTRDSTILCWGHEEEV